MKKKKVEICSNCERLEAEARADVVRVVRQRDKAELAVYNAYKKERTVWKPLLVESKAEHAGNHHDEPCALCILITEGER